MIALEDVDFAYDGTTVLQDVSAHIDAGETVAVMGPNGAGKTTVMKLVAGLLDPAAGRIRLDGEHRADSDVVVGLAPENPDDALFEGSVRDEVAFFPRNRGLPVADHVSSALEVLAIEDLADRTPQTLSQGEKRLVSLAAVLSGDPDVVGLDEPTSGLDAPARARLGESLEALSRTVLFATHDADFAWAYADAAVVLADGQVRHDGPVESVLGDGTLDFGALGLDEPGPVRWARENGFETPPADPVEAAAWLSGGPD